MANYVEFMREWVERALAGSLPAQQVTQAAAPPTPYTATSATFTTSAASLAAGTSLVGASTARRGLLLSNQTDQTVLLRFGAAPTTSLYSWKLVPGEQYMLPYAITSQVYALATAAGTGVMMITVVTGS